MIRHLAFCFFREEKPDEFRCLPFGVGGIAMSEVFKNQTLREFIASLIL